MPFSPKFVDLVKNSTTVQGSGAVTLGAAVSGFTGFAQALSAGDQFYYCLQNIDKPAEREVGRGTMQSDGRIARDPIGGAATNFTGGTKTISLVAAAEWYAGQKPGVIQAATRAALAGQAGSAGAAAVVAEVRRDGLFRFDAGNLAAHVAADPLQGVFIAPTSDPSGASGAWVRSGATAGLDLRWFGAIEDDATDARPAIIAAMAVAEYLGRRLDVIYGAAVPIHFPPGAIYVSAAIDLYATHKFIGHNSGSTFDMASQVRFPAGTSGFRPQYYTTSGASGFGETAHGDSRSSEFIGLRLVGAWNGSNEGEFHAIHARSTPVIRKCAIYKWQGNGINIDCDATGTVNQGNGNLFLIEDVTVVACRDGIYANGGDANAGEGRRIDASSNRRWGINDSSFLGNSWYACHTADNGLACDGGSGIPTMVSHSGKVYAVRAGQDAGAAINAPSGTTADNAYYYYTGVGGASPANNIPMWSSGMAVRAGGAYRSDEFAANALFEGCYSEGGQGPSQLSILTIVIGGTHGAGIRGGMSLLASGGYLTTGAFQARELDVTGSLTRIGPASGVVDTTNVRIRGVGLTTNLDFYSYDADGTGESFDARLQGYRGGHLMASALNSINLQASSAYIGIVSDYSGGLVVVSPNHRIGYGPGNFTGSPGGAVAQITSKATGVTLNKPCGQVTLDAAALAAGASVTARVTNSKISNQDTLVINLKAGSGTAGAYRWRAEVGAGFFDLVVTNESAGSLSEALIFNFAILQARNS